MCVDMEKCRITENVFTLLTYNSLMLLSTSECPCPRMPVPDRPGPTEGQGIRAGDDGCWELRSAVETEFKITLSSARPLE